VIKYFNKIVHKSVSLALVAVFLSSAILHAEVVDDFIFLDAEEDNIIWDGTSAAIDIISSNQFNDLGAAWPGEVVARSAALGIIRGEGASFRPNDYITREEALAFVIRAIGLSGQATALGSALEQQLAAAQPVEDEDGNIIGGPVNLTAQQMINLGYNTLAVNLGIVLADFPTTGTASRQEVAYLVYSAILHAGNNIFSQNIPLQTVYTFADWQDIFPRYLIAIENIVSANIMQGDGASFIPDAPVTRGQMAQIMANLDTVLFDIQNLERRIGTVAAIRDSQLTLTGEAELERSIFVRLGNGSVEVLRMFLAIGPSPQTADLDAVVFSGGVLGGMSLLQEGDTIEFLIHPESNTVVYINVTTEAVQGVVQGFLFSIDYENRQMTIRDAENRQFVYSISEGLLLERNNTQYILMDYLYPNAINQLQFGSIFELTLLNNVVTSISFVGQQVLVNEIRGLVVENNPGFGYMVIINNLGQRVTMRYYENEMQVQRQSHWDYAGGLGYIAHLFPNFNFNPLASTIANIRPGDIVFIRADDADASVISMISAASNYIMRYGAIRQINHNEGFMTVLMEFETGQTAWFDIASSILITRDGRRITSLNIQLGDWARVLVNEAIVAPGHIISSIVEMAIAGYNRHISSIVRGELAGINPMQNQLIIEHAQTLTGTGWSNHRELERFNISGNGISYFYNDKQISREEASRQFGRSGATVYIALENHFAGERVSMVSFRTQRDEVLNPDTVIAADGTGSIQLASVAGNIQTDAGTIVRRHGRLVSGVDIFPSDFLKVVLNGQGRAAVIDIIPQPDTSALQIMRARVESVRTGVSFTVQSMSQLFGNNWVFTPVQRLFEIDHRTVFLNEDGFVNPNTFITYTDDSVFNQVFTIVTDGARASHIINAPFANRALRGTIFNNDDGTISLRDVSIQNPSTNQWTPVSNVNNTVVINTTPATLFGRNNEVVQARVLQNGDQVLVLTNTIPNNPTPGMEIDGLIVLVD